MLRRASQSGLASAIKSIAFDSTAPTVATAAAVTLVVTTVDNHNLYPGARVSFTGIASSNSDAAYNVTGQWLYKIISPTSFSITPTLTYASQPTFTLTNATLWAPNAALNAYNILYGQPVTIPRPTFYNYAYPTITATPSGTGVLVTWDANGIANPAIDSVKVERLSGSSVVATLSSGIDATNFANTIFETGLAGVTLATIGSGNSYTYRVTAKSPLQSNIITQDITTLYYNNIASVTSSVPPATPTYIQVSWAAATGNTSVSNYEVERATNSGFTVGTSTLSTAVSGSSTSYIDTTAAISTDYYYRVRARKDFTYSSTSYPMYSNYATTASSIRVTAINTTLNVNTISNTSYGTGAVVSGTISPNPTGGTVTITESGVTVGTATVGSSGTYTTTLSTTTSVATHNLSLSYGGNGIYQPSTNTASFTVSKANTSITAVPGSATTYPSTPTITGSVLPNPGTLTWTFTLTGNSVPDLSGTINSSGNYSFVAPSGNAGTYSGTVAFPGNANYNASSSSVSYTINSNATNTTGAVSTTVINIGSSVTLSVNLKTASGSNVASQTVGWEASTDNSNWSHITTATTDASGNATYVWTPGSSSWNYVRAYYNGSTNYDASIGSAIAFNIRAKYTVTTTVSGTANTYKYYAKIATNGQVASTWTAPTISGAVNLTVTGIALSIAGRTGYTAPSVAAGLWTGASSGTLLANSNNVTLGLKADGGATLVSFDFTSDLAVSQGSTYFVGFWRNQGTVNMYTQYDLDTSSGLTTKYDSSTTSSITTFTNNATTVGDTLLYTVTYYYYK